MNDHENEMITWNIQRLEFLQKDHESEKYKKIEEEIKAYWHRKGFIEGMKWALHAQARYDESHGNQIIGVYNKRFEEFMKKHGLDFDQEIVVKLTKEGFLFGDIT